jgi:MurNAc alpha-1-phosphate uridylyltransferase
MQCLILAGGLGTRMQEYDPTLPKTLLPVAGRPFADWQLEWLRSEGVESVVYSIGHLGEQIRQFVGTGERWDLSVEFVEESAGLRGTGGAIRLAADHGVLADHFFVLYGDSYLRLDLAGLDAHFAEERLPAIMTVFANEGRWDTSNVVFDGSLVTRYRKDSPEADPSMAYIDYGLSVLDRGVVTERIPPDRHVDLAALMADLSDDRLLGGFEVYERFYEIGSPDGIAELGEYLTSG